MSVIYLLWKMLWDDSGSRIPFLISAHETRELADVAKKNTKLEQKDGYMLIDPIHLEEANKR